MIRKFEKEYKWLSNFTPCRIVLKGVVFSSVEHAYMSAKSDDLQWKAVCADSSIKARKIKKMSAHVALVENWAAIKVEVMKACLIQKYNQEPFRTLLLETGDQYIQEGNFWGDTFWGVDLETGEGDNILGKLLMEIRDKLRATTQLQE